MLISKNLGLAGLLALSYPFTLAAELLIDTTSGPVHGFYNDTGHTVRAFLGIPYAEPPVGARRFAAPEPKSRSTAVLNASSFGATCPGIYSYDPQSIWSVLPYIPWNTAEMSEDCLTVNIWTPAAEKHPGRYRHGKGAAVMMFVYGGAFTQGGSALTFYDGSNIVRDHEDVIVVTFNYRVTVFGYPNAPEMPSGQQNVGLLDQRLAVEWVHRNIHRFGGDASRIMLFGQSAGAASTDMYSFAYPDDPLVQATGLLSGAATIIRSTDFGHDNWHKLSTALGCDSLECMRKVPFNEILDEVSTGYDFAPVEDNVTVFSDYATRAKKGRIAKVPTLLGGTDREASAYFPMNSSSINETAMYAGLQTTFNCPLQQAALLRLQQNLPTWRYLYHGNWSNLSPVTWLGAYHSSDIPLVFGTYNLSGSEVASTSQEVQASRYIQSAWVAFAKDPRDGLRRVGWPEFDPNGSTLVNLALNNSISAIFTSAAEWDSHCHGGEFIP